MSDLGIYQGFGRLIRTPKTDELGWVGNSVCVEKGPKPIKGIDLLITLDNWSFQFFYFWTLKEVKCLTRYSGGKYGLTIIYESIV